MCLSKSASRVSSIWNSRFSAGLYFCCRRHGCIAGPGCPHGCQLNIAAGNSRAHLQPRLFEGGEKLVARGQARQRFLLRRQRFFGRRHGEGSCRGRRKMDDQGTIAPLGSPFCKRLKSRHQLLSTFYRRDPLSLYTPSAVSACSGLETEDETPTCTEEGTQSHRNLPTIYIPSSQKLSVTQGEQLLFASFSLKVQRHRAGTTKGITRSQTGKNFIQGMSFSGYALIPPRSPCRTTFSYLLHKRKTR